MPDAPTSALPGSGVRLAVGGAVAATVAVAALLGAEPLTGMSPGALLAELRGQTRTETYAVAADAPAARVPGWLPASATDVVVKRPGEDQGLGPGAVAVDAAVPADWALPAGCAATAGWSQPWNGGGQWPLTRATALVACPDGGTSWTAFLHSGHLYAWR